MTPGREIKRLLACRSLYKSPTPQLLELHIGNMHRTLTSWSTKMIISTSYYLFSLNKYSKINRTFTKEHFDQDACIETWMLTPVSNVQ